MGGEGFSEVGGVSVGFFRMVTDALLLWQGTRGWSVELIWGGSCGNGDNI